MPRNLPPLNSIRAFEATARHLSFSKAADELAVTPAALSHQVRALEERLGLQLFHRRARGIELTESARLIYPGIHAAFETMKGALQRLDRAKLDNILVVSATPGFTVKWLVPRLQRFLDAHPEIDARISASLGLANFGADGVDVAIRYVVGTLPPPEFHVEKLMEDTVLPLCSPRLRDGPAPLRRPEDLARHTLIHVELPPPFPSPPGWVDWLARVGVDSVDASRGLRFNASDHAIDAAVEGAGVVLGHRTIALNDLQAGRLVVPFGPELPAGGRGYHLVCRHGDENRPKIRAFRDWLFAEIATATEALGADLGAPRPARRQKRA
jgi:LysR family glycine cleavage system transcriptional activator